MAGVMVFLFLDDHVCAAVLRYLAWPTEMRAPKCVVGVFAKEMQFVGNGLRACDHLKISSNIFATNWPTGARPRIACCRLIQLFVASNLLYWWMDIPPPLLRTNYHV